MRNFSGRGNEWLLQLDGIELASFWRRAFAFLIDAILIVAMLLGLAMGGTILYLKTRQRQGHPIPAHSEVKLGPGKIEIVSTDSTANTQIDSEWGHVLTEVALPVLYFGLLGWITKGRSVGKWLLRIRVVSIVHPHFTFWHSVERALGYGAATLEFGFGFLQFFIHPYRRCAQDRLAETIVVTERGYKAIQLKPIGHTAEFTHAIEAPEPRLHS